MRHYDEMDSFGLQIISLMDCLRIGVKLNTAGTSVKNEQTKARSQLQELVKKASL